MPNWCENYLRLEVPTKQDADIIDAVLNENRQVYEDYRKEIQTSIGVIHELGGAIFLCGSSLNERGLVATMGDYKFTISSAAKRISQVVDKGWQIAVF